MTKSNQERMIFEWENIIEFADLLKQQFLQNGCPESLAEKIKEVTIKQQKEVFPLPNDIEEMKVNTRLTLGGLHYDILLFLGHCDTLITLWNEKNKMFISSDSILPHITPNVGVWPKVKPNPLKRFLNSLEKIIELEPAITLPGHGSSMKDTISRAKSIITHHKNRFKRNESIN